MNIPKLYETLSDWKSVGHWWPAQSRFEVILGAVLTINTSWTNVEKVMDGLKEKELLSRESFNEMSREEISTHIRSSGFFNQKAGTIMRLLEFLNSDEYFLEDPKMPRRSELLSVKGIGEETADSILLYAYDVPVFVVDAYTRRLFSRLPVEVGKEGLRETVLIHLTEADQLKAFHGLIVEVCKAHCRKTPSCDNCPLKADCRRLNV